MLLMLIINLLQQTTTKYLYYWRRKDRIENNVFWYTPNGSDTVTHLRQTIASLATKGCGDRLFHPPWKHHRCSIPKENKPSKTRTMSHASKALPIRNFRLRFREFASAWERTGRSFFWDNAWVFFWQVVELHRQPCISAVACRLLHLPWHWHILGFP